MAAGDARTLPAVASLLSCEPAGGRLAPAVYDLYARVVVTPDDGTPKMCFGGPWPLRVRDTDPHIGVTRCAASTISR